MISGIGLKIGGLKNERGKFMICSLLFDTLMTGLLFAFGDVLLMLRDTFHL